MREHLVFGKGEGGGVMEVTRTKNLTFPNNTFHTVLCTKERIPSILVSLLFPCGARKTIIILVILPDAEL